MRDRASVQTIKLASSENNSKIAVKAFQGSSKEAFPLDALPTGEAALEFKIDDSFNFIRPKSRIMTAHSTRNHNKNPSNVSVVKKLVIGWIRLHNANKVSTVHRLTDEVVA